jgi:hypothetical protein
MGRQVNFYMMPEDEREFVAFVRSERNVGIFKSVIPTPEIPLLDQLPLMHSEDYWYSLWLWDREHSPEPTFRYVPQQNYYRVESFGPEVIQFQRCTIDNGRLVRGRIWAEMKYWRFDDPPVIITKSESFQKWYGVLARWIKKHSVRDAREDYVLPAAAEFAKNGGRLVQAVMADGRAL